MVNYQFSKIYKLWSPSKNLVYYGSTCETLAKRLTKHKYNCKIYNNDNTKTFVTSFLVLECEDYKIELVEEYACNNKTQLLKKESEYIRNNDCVNKVIPDRTYKEYMKDYREINADKLKAQVKEYQTINNDALKEYRKQYYKQYHLKKKAENQL